MEERNEGFTTGFAANKDKKEDFSSVGVGTGWTQSPVAKVLSWLKNEKKKKPATGGYAGNTREKIGSPEGLKASGGK